MSGSRAYSEPPERESYLLRGELNTLFTETVSANADD